MKITTDGILNKMKTAVSFIFSFIMMCLVGTVFTALIFMAGKNLMYLVAGQPLSFFSLDFFLQGLFVMFPLICVIAQLLLILYIIRHPAGQILPFIMFTIISFCSWVILIPCDMQLADSYIKKSAVEEKPAPPMTPGYFREEVGGVYYYTRLLENGNADGVLLDVNDRYGSRKGGVYKFYDQKTANASAVPYADVLVKKAVEPSGMISYPMKVYNTLIDTAMKSWKSGFSTWLAFASLGLAFYALYGLQFASSWRLLNSFLILLFGNGISYLNYLIYIEKFFPEFVLAVTEKVSFISGPNPFIVLVNLVLFIIFAVYGVVMRIYRLKKRPIDDNDQE